MNHSNGPHPLAPNKQRGEASRWVQNVNCVPWALHTNQGAELFDGFAILNCAHAQETEQASGIQLVEGPVLRAKWAKVQ